MPDAPKKEAYLKYITMKQQLIKNYVNGNLDIETFVEQLEFNVLSYVTKKYDNTVEEE